MDTSERELQQYLFDLQGYLVIHNVSSPGESLRRVALSCSCSTMTEHETSLQTG